MTPAGWKPQIYDCFTYNDEELLLTLRLETLKNVVDKFVIAEAPFTFTGKPKPLHFDPSRFQKFADKIIHVVVDDMPLGSGTAWTNEEHQRNALVRGLTQALPHDWIMLSDVDEIPRPDAILRYRPWNLAGTFVQRFYSYFINNLAIRDGDPRQLRWWTRSKITTFGHLNKFFGTFQNLRIYKRSPGIAGTTQYLHYKLRRQRLREGGWHFSWLMTPEQMIRKIESFSHTEYDLPRFKSVDAIRSAIAEGRDIFEKGERFRLVEVDDSFPCYLAENFDQFRAWHLGPSAQEKKDGS